MRLFEVALEMMGRMRGRNELPHTVSFSNRGWDRVRSEVDRYHDPFSYVAGVPRTFVGLPYVIDRKQEAPLLVLTREQVSRRKAEAGVNQLVER